MLFISDNFPPVVGGSSTVYDQICKHNAESVVGLSSKVSYQLERKVGWDAYDADCGFLMYRQRFLRAPKRASPIQNPLQRLSGFLEELFINVQIILRVLWLCLRHRHRVICIGDLIYGGWIGLFAKYVLRKRFVVYCHGEEITQHDNGAYAGLRGTFLRAADLVLVVSDFCRSEILKFGVDGANIKVILNGVDTEKFTPGRRNEELSRKYQLDGKRIILGVGRHVERKGFDNLIAALPMIRGRVRDAHLFLIGEGPATEQLKELVFNLELGECVTLLGSVPDPVLADWYRFADVFVLPNRTLQNGDTEGFGLVFLEANACGTPVVGGRAGGTSEAVIDGETGLLVDARYPAEIAKAITRLFEDDGLRRRLSERGLEHARQLTWRKQAARFAALIDSLS